MGEKPIWRSITGKSREFCKTKTAKLLAFNDLAAQIVGVLGLEPRMTGPESVVLPLHHTPMSIAIRNTLVPSIAGAKVVLFLELTKF